MSHIISYTEEIEETGFGPERPALETGERYLCQVDGKNLTKVVFSPMVAIVYPIAFSYSGLKEMVFNDEIPVFLHISSIDHCDALPPFDRIFESPFPDKYMFRGGQAFEVLCPIIFFMIKTRGRCKAAFFVDIFLEKKVIYDSFFSIFAAS